MRLLRGERVQLFEHGRGSLDRIGGVTRNEVSLVGLDERFVHDVVRLLDR